MKKVYLILICLFICKLNVNAQIYHEDDKEGLRQFLRQACAKTSTNNKQWNYEILLFRPGIL